MLNLPKDWLAPQLVRTFTSRFNTQIQLVKFMGRLRLDMGELTQSGHIIETIWNSAFNSLLPSGFIPKTVLILGFCGGSTAKLIRRKWPLSQITGIEIDPVVIEIAKTYFKIPKEVNLVNQDAVQFVEKLKENYDLILVDCYLGHIIPHQFEELNFLKKLKKHSTHLLLNCLFWEEHKTKTLEFMSRLESDFT